MDNIGYSFRALAAMSRHMSSFAWLGSLGVAAGPEGGMCRRRSARRQCFSLLLELGESFFVLRVTESCTIVWLPPE